LHHFGEIALRGLQDRMDVVGQQAVTQKSNVLLLTVKRKLLQIPFSIVIVAKYCLAVIPSTNHMINGSGVFDPNRSRHGAKLPRLRPCRKQIHLCKPDPKDLPLKISPLFFLAVIWGRR